MEWITLYIKGRDGFKSVVLARLARIILHGSSQLNHDVLMVWANGSRTLRSLKLVVGAETIFRYRLEFFTDLNEHLDVKAAKNNLHLSMHEIELLRKMREVKRSMHA